MRKDSDREIVIKLLQELGFEAFKIPEEPQKGRRADVRATKDKQSFLIEVKSKEDHSEFMSELRKANAFKIIEYKKELRRSDTFGKIIREGAKQLDETPDEVGSFKCIWFRAVEALIPDAFEFMKATLYGTALLLVRDQSNHFSCEKCYYFEPSEFFILRSLEGVILDNGQKAELCINTFSNRRDEFQRTALYCLFEQKGAITDPHKLEKQGKILVVDKGFSRKDKDILIKFILEKYGFLHARQFPMKVIGGGIIGTPD